MTSEAAPAWQRELFERRTIGVHLGLDVIRAAYRQLGEPAAKLPAVHIVGTNGKGSTSAMVAHGLRRVGRRVGLFTSPHLHRIAERIRIDGVPVEDPVLERWIGEVLAVEQAGDLGGALSFFEILTLAGLLAFVDAKVDVAVVECGLGGRLDATRIASSALTLITPIALDHQRWLGPDLEAIAGEKAAVMENRAPTISAAQDPIAAAVIERAAERWQTSLHWADLAPRAPQGLPGEHQRQNAGLALAALRHLLGEAPLTLLDGVRWPGRLESIDVGGGRMLFDVAHNPHGIAALRRYLASAPAVGGRLIVFGAMLGKEAPAMVRDLASLGSPMLLVPPADRDGWAPSDLAAAIDTELPVATVSSIDSREATGPIQEHLARGGEVVVCGSCYLVGAIRGRVIGEQADGVLLADPMPRG